MRQKITMEALLPASADLREAARQSTSGDPASYSMGQHQGRNPNRRDTDGLTKRAIHDAALDHNSRLFDDLAARLIVDPWDLPASLRTLVPKSEGHPEKGTRPIDDPAEYKRLIVLHVRQLLERKLEQALTDGQYGGRPKWAIQPRCLRPGSTHQDHVATAIWQSIWKGYKYCLLLDLKNAFGLVPRGAALHCLQYIGLDQQAAEWVWRMVRIDAVDSRSRRPVASSPQFGIEQGNPLSASLMNLVLAPIFKMLEAHLPVKVVSYLDDIYIMARTEEDAHQSFYRFQQSARLRGFTNVRRLWGPGDPTDTKLSLIIDTQTATVPVLKTYMVNSLGIALDPKKVVELQAEGVMTTKTTLSNLRRASNCQALTKQAVRSMNPNVLRRPPATMEGVKVTQGSPPTTVEVERDHIDLGSEDRSSSEGVLTEVLLPFGHQREIQGTCTLMEYTRRGTGVLGDLICRNHLPEPGVHVVDATLERKGELPTHTGVVVPQVSAFPLKPCMGYEDFEACSISFDGESYRTEGGNTQDRRRSETTDSSACLCLLQPDVVEVIKAGRAFKLGSRYKDALLDLRGIENLVESEHQLRMVVNGLIKAVRVRRRALVRVDVFSPLLGTPHILGGTDDLVYRRIKSRVLPDGTVELVLLMKEPRLRKKSIDTFPKVELLLNGVTQHDRARGSLRVTYEHHGHRYCDDLKVPGPSPSAVALTAVAHVLSTRQPKSAAIRLVGPLSVAQELPMGIAPRQVVLHDAVDILLGGWSWEHREGWAVGCIRT